MLGRRFRRTVLPDSVFSHYFSTVRCRIPCFLTFTPTVHCRPLYRPTVLSPLHSPLSLCWQFLHALYFVTPTPSLDQRDACEEEEGKVDGPGSEGTSGPAPSPKVQVGNDLEAESRKGKAEARQPPAPPKARPHPSTRARPLGTLALTSGTADHIPEGHHVVMNFCPIEIDTMLIQ